MRPYHKHDCTFCTYLGSTTLHNSTADWYRHGHTVIARFGNAGSNYWSMPIEMVNDDKYTLAYDMRRHEQEGLEGDDTHVITGMLLLARIMLGYREGKKNAA